MIYWYLIISLIQYIRYFVNLYLHQHDNSYKTIKLNIPYWLTKLSQIMLDSLMQLDTRVGVCKKWLDEFQVVNWLCFIKI